MPTDTQQTASISITTSGRLIYGFLNLKFIFTLLGALQIAALLLGLIVVSLLAASVTNNSNEYGSRVSSFTFVTFLFMVSFWCLMSTFLLVTCSMTSLVTAALIPRTSYFTFVNAICGLFYLSASVNCLSRASQFAYITHGSSVNQVPLINTAAGIGIGVTILYFVITFLAGFKYWRLSRAT